MPQIDWTPEFKRTTTPEFDRLKLKVNERARIVCLEKPTFAWVHTLRGPKIVDGLANKVMKKRKDGTEYADWDMDFIGRPQCLGDHGVIADNGMDPANCPVCARAKDSEEVTAPERRFAMNIIKYATKADGSLVSPFGCASQVWTFTEGVFNKLYDIANEYGGLVGRDLILGPCQAPEMFQKFDISAGAKNVWESDDKIKSIVEDTHKQNRIENLEAACGRKTEARWLKEDVEKVAARWRVAHGKADQADGTEKGEIKSLKGELDNLLAAPPAASSPPQGDSAAAPVDNTAPQEPDDFSKLLAGLKI